MGSMNAFDGRAKLTACPGVMACAGVPVINVGADNAFKASAKVSDPESPPVSVAVTMSVRACALFGALPEKVRLEGSKLSQLGKT